MNQDLGVLGVQGIVKFFGDRELKSNVQNDAKNLKNGVLIGVLGI